MTKNQAALVQLFLSIVAKVGDKVGRKDSSLLSLSSSARDIIPIRDNHVVFAALLGQCCNDKALGCWQDLPVCTKGLCFKQVWKEMASEQRGG